MINVHFFVHRVDIAHNLGKKSVFLFTAPTSWLDATTTAANLFPQVLPGKASEETDISSRISRQESPRRGRLNAPGECRAKLVT